MHKEFDGLFVRRLALRAFEREEARNVLANMHHNSMCVHFESAQKRRTGGAR